MNLVFVVLLCFFLVGQGLPCGVQAFYSCKERGLLFITVRGLLTVVASRVVEYEF